MKKIKVTIISEMTDEAYNEDFREQLENPNLLREMEQEETDPDEGILSVSITMELLS